MKLILGADAIHPPLTGIGRYAFELARRLMVDPDVSQLSFFSMGRWVDWAALLAADGAIDSAVGTAPPAPNLNALGNLRRTLAKNRLAVSLYGRLTPALYRWRLRPHSDAVFHSPNYFLPPHSGATVATIHDLSHVWFPTFHPAARVEFLNRALPESLRRADQLITDCEFVRREVIEHFNWPADRIKSVSLGVDPRYAPRALENLETELAPLDLKPQSYALFVGTVEPRKNIDTLLTAYERLPLRLRREYPLVIAGSSGWNSDAIHARFDRASSDGWLKYLNFLPQALLPSLYSGARLFVYPSIYEGFGLPPLEALASGVPVLCSNASSLPEVVGEAGRLIDPMDIDAWADAIESSLQNEEWQRTAKITGPAHASNFTWEKCATETVAVYREVAGA